MKLKHDTISNSFDNDGLISAEISKNVGALKLSRVRRLYCEQFHEWEIIPLKYPEGV